MGEGSHCKRCVADAIARATGICPGVVVDRAAHEAEVRRKVAGEVRYQARQYETLPHAENPTWEKENHDIATALRRMAAAIERAGEGRDGGTARLREESEKETTT